MSYIIRCKDCKYFNAWRTSECAEKYGQIYECSKLVISCPSPDNYCSKAEKKEAQKFGKWISVSERLPREREDVLVTCFVHENWQTKIGYWNGKAWVINAYDILFIDRLEVTAWMPLPTPYKPQESED